MIFHGNMMTAALALTLAPRQAPTCFQQCYVDPATVGPGREVPVRLILSALFDAGPILDMERPIAFHALHRGVLRDLTPTLSPVPFRGAFNEAVAWEGRVILDGEGEHVLVTVPEPHFDRSERIWIQQITKVALDAAGPSPEGGRPLGLKAEIVPAAPSHGMVAGTALRARVLADGRPVADAAVEIERMAAEPDLARNCLKPWSERGRGGSVVVTSDRDGWFEAVLPRPGLWGVAALGVGPDRAHREGFLRQDAVLWLRVSGDQAVPSEPTAGAQASPSSGASPRIEA